MNSTLKFLSLSGGMLIGSLLAACASGSDSNDPTGTGGMGTTGGSKSTSGAGGATGGGGTTGSGGSAIVETPIYSFNSDLEGFEFSTVAGTAPYVNLVPPAGMTYALPGDAPLLGWGSKDYDLAAMPAGSLTIAATFSGWNQQVSAEVKGLVDKMQAPLDLSNKTLRARVFLEKGLSARPEAPGGVVFYLKTGTDYSWGQADWRNLDKPGTWITVEFKTAEPAVGSDAAFDASEPVQLGFQISSGGGGTTPPPFGDPLETVVYIDQVTWSN